MPTNNNINYGPTPLPGTVTTPVLGNNIDRAPEAVPAGPATGVNPTSTASVVPVVELPVAADPPSSRTVIPVTAAAVDVTGGANTVSGPNLTASNQQRYITILANGTVITNNATTLNFTGNGVSVSALGTTGANIVITAGNGGGSDYGNSNVSSFLAAYGSNTISTTGNVTGGNILGNIQAPDGDGSIIFNQNGFLGAAAGFNYQANTGTLFATAVTGRGNTTTGVGAFYGGVPGFTLLGSAVLAQITGNSDTYSQFNLQNISTGNSASADYIITADNGTDTTHYVDLGMAGSNHADPAFFGDTSSANDGYLYVAGTDQAGPSNGVGNLILGSTNGTIKLFVGNTAQANVITTVTQDGLVMENTPSGPSNQIKYGMGNLVAWLDGQWTIGEYDSSTDTYGATGIRISPGIEGSAEVILPSNDTASVTPLQVNNYAGNVQIETGNGSTNRYWTFDGNGAITLPPGGYVQTANSYPTLLAYGSGDHGGPELDWANTDNLSNLNSANVLRHTMYLNDEEGLYIGFNENGVANVASPSWLFTPSGNLTVPGGIVFPTGESIITDNDLMSLSATDGNTNININGGARVINLNANVEVGWAFDDTGNLTLPGNTFAVNYANGTPVSLGSGNTGNVTFDNATVQGVPGYGLQLSPTPDDTANLKYLQVRAGDTDSHIHFDTGDNTTYDQYFGDDGKFLRLDAGTFGNVTIGTQNPGEYYRWTFDNLGNTIVPGDINSITTGFAFTSAITGITAGATVIVDLADNSIFGGPEEGQVTISGVVGTTEANATWYYQAVEANQIQLFYSPNATNPVDGTGWAAYESGGLAVAAGYSDLSVTGGNVSIRSNPIGINQTANTWTFGADGTTTFPGLSTQRGDTTSGTISGYTLRIGDGTNEAVITTPDGITGYDSSQRLVINPGKGRDGTSGEGGDIYLWAGRGGDTGGSGGDIKIRGGQGMGEGGAGGYIRMEAGDGDSAGGGAPGYIDITGGYGGSGQTGGYVHILGGTGTTGGGEANVTGGYAYSGEGGNVNLIGGGSNDGLSHYGNVNISAGASTWTFDNTGSFVFPGGGVTMDGGSYSLLTSGIANASIGTFVQGADSGVGWEYQGDGADANTSYGAVSLDTAGTANTANLQFKVQLVADQGNASTNKEWIFNTAGNLTTPGNIITGSGSGGNISGANVVSANVFIAAGNITGGSATFTGGTLTFANTTSSIINFQQYGVGAPTFTTRSEGTKIVLYDQVNGSNVDYAIGISNANLWLSIPQNSDSYNSFAWYGGQTKVMSLGGAGTLSTVGNVTGGNLLTGGLISATGNITGGNLNATTGVANVANLYLGNGYVNTSASAALNLVPGGAGGTRVWSKLVPNANVSFSLGSSTEYWANGYIGNTISTTVSATGNITGANLIATANVLGNGYARFTGTFDESQASTAGLYLGYAGGTPRMMFGTGNTSQTFEIDNDGGNLRFYQPGSTKATLTSGGDFSVAGNVTGNTAGYAIGYRDIPQVSFTGNATIATTDAGKHYYSTQSTSYTLTIANNASQGFQVGSAITIVNQGTGNITIAQGSGVTLYIAGNSTSGNRTVSTFGMATLIKVATDTWFINGTGVS